MSLNLRRSAKVRSAISNGSTLFLGEVDGRSETGRRYADLARGQPVDPEALGQLGDRMARQARQMGPPKAPERKSLRQHVARGAGA